MKLNKEFDSITESLARTLKYADDYGDEEMYEILSVIMAFYLGGKIGKFHKFFLGVVERYQNYEGE